MSPLRLAVRHLRRAPGFAAAAVLTVALSVAAACSVFALVNAVLLRPLAFPQSERLVGIWHTMPGLDVPLAKQATGTYAVYRESAKSFESMGLYLPLSATLAFSAPGTETERARVGYVTASTLTTLRARPLVGRLIAESDQRRGVEPVALISEALWRQRFKADTNVTSRSITVDGIARHIVGVMPASFAFPEARTPVWLPIDPDPKGYVGGFGWNSVARLRPGVAVATAQEELSHLLPRVLERFPEARPGVSTARAFEQTRLAPRVHTLHDDVVGGFDRVLALLGATVGILVIVAFSNLSLLLLVRIEARQRELAVCSALGASRSAVLWRVLGEATLVAVVGGAVGFGLAALAIRALVGVAPLDIPRLGEIRVDAQVFCVAAALSVAFIAVSVAIAALRIQTRDVIRLLRDGGRTATSGRSGQRVRALFVGVEVALSLVLLAGAGALGHSMMRLRAVQPGFESSNLFTFWTFLPRAQYKTDADAAHFYSNAIERLQRIPGVTSVSATAKLPLEIEGFAYRVLVYADNGADQGALPPVFQTTTATSGYFATMRIPLIAGRTFDDANARRGALEAVASRGFIEHFWHDATGRSGVGKRLRPTANGPWFTIVGVVDDTRDSTLTQPPNPGVYFPEEVNGDTSGNANTTARDMAFVVRTRSTTPAIVDALRRELRAMDPTLPFYRAAWMDQIVADARARLTFALAVLGAGAAATLLLGVVGLYGVIAYAVGLRSREISIRIALGLTPDGASRMLLRQGVLVAGAGLAIGLAIFLAFAKLLNTLSFDVPTVDPASLAVALVIVAAIAVLATWVPARRAARVNPTDALRAD